MRLRATLLLLATASVAKADEGKVLVYQASTISQPGHYLLTRDLPASAVNAFTISAADVTLDLGGHHIVRSGGGTAVNLAAGADNVVIRNGRITGGYYGVSYSGATRIRVAIEDLTIADTTLAAINLIGVGHLSVERCTISDPGSYAIYADGSSAAFGGRIVDNVVVNAAQGIRTLGLAGGLIAGNQLAPFVGTNTQAIYLSATVGWNAGRNIVRDNTVQGTTSTGTGIYFINTTDNVVTGNVCGGFTNGIVLSSSRCRVERNSCSGNTGSGILVSGDHNAIVANLASDNGGSGISITGIDCFVLENTFSGNTGYGISAGSASNRYRGNYLLANTAGAATGGGDAGSNVTF